MKKIFLTLISLFIVVGLYGCSSDNKEEENSTSIANPIVEYNSLQEINDKLNVKFVTPGVMGVTEETYEIIDDTIAQYCFKVNGISYIMRAAHNPENGISGVYYNDGLLDDLIDKDGYASSDTGKLYSWYEEIGNDATLYTIYCEDNGTFDKETFLNIASELRFNIDEAYGINSSDSSNLTGVYYDQTSQRATATVENTNNGSYSIIVSWSNSAFDYTEWSMNATADEDGNLVYTDCVKKNIVSDDSGKVTSEETEYSDGVGYFKVDANGKLSWEGSAEESCQSCLFVKE